MRVLEVSMQCMIRIFHHLAASLSSWVKYILRDILTFRILAGHFPLPSTCHIIAGKRVSSCVLQLRLLRFSSQHSPFEPIRVESCKIMSYRVHGDASRFQWQMQQCQHAISLFSWCCNIKAICHMMAWTRWWDAALLNVWMSMYSFNEGSGRILQRSPCRDSYGPNKLRYWWLRGAKYYFLLTGI